MPTASSAQRFSGHGSAMAQCYNHMIMPLANARDKLTQVVWGIEDFRHRFGRDPEGMWLPETAVDLETLDTAGRSTASSSRSWRRRRPNRWTANDVSGQRIDPDARLPAEAGIGPFHRSCSFTTDRFRRRSPSKAC